MVDGPWVFETERLRARPWRLQDAEAAFRLYGDPEVTRHIGGEPEPDLDAMRARLALIIERTTAFGGGLGSFPAFDADGVLAAAKEPPAGRTASAFDSPAFNYTMDAEDDIT